MKRSLEFAAAWLSLKFLDLLPRTAARAFGSFVARLAYALRPPLRRAGLINLRIAFPDWTDARRRRVLRDLARHLGWMAAELVHLHDLDRTTIDRVVIPDGFENFVAAHHRGKGVLYLTGHMGAWELGPPAQALFGFPLHFLVRPIDNPRVHALVNRYRCFSGNVPVDKTNSVRTVLRVLRSGGAVGILMDLNALPGEGVFVDFFGVPACTTTGLARLALQTDAAVIPVYCYWDPQMRKYGLRFEPALDLVRSGDLDADVLANTQRFTRVIEDFARRHPDQWLWIHNRWKTRPPGLPPLY